VIVPLASARDESELGGKAVGLGKALRAGLPVPAGFALGAELVGRVAAGEPQACDSVAALADTLSGPLAARSSALGEDGARASFAGQHLTRLGITSGRELVEAVRAVETSARAPAALAYRARLGVPGPPRMGVVVQRVVAARVAGVMFTRNPVGGADEIVIEASWGLGEVVVAGRVVPDRFRVAREGAILERTTGEKDIAVRLDDRSARIEHEVERHDARRLCLSDEELVALASVARHCEDLIGTAADVEWAFDTGELFVLQLRPLTHSAQHRGTPA
jgi:pyruvate,water dikinase